MTSGSIWEPPLMVRVAVVLMKGRTPILVYTSGLDVVAAAAGEGAAAARPGRRGHTAAAEKIAPAQSGNGCFVRLRICLTYQ